MRLALIIAFVAVALLTPWASAGTPSCQRLVTGGEDEERAAVGRILCLMPGTSIENVRISEHPPDAPPDSLWVGIVAPPQATSFPREARREWEAAIAAGAIRDGFERLGLRRAVAYQLMDPGSEPTPAHLQGMALPGWGAKRWQVGPRPTRLGRGVGTWAQLQAKLDRLSRRWRVPTRLERYNPFSKAPVVTLTVQRSREFFRSGAAREYLDALLFREERYDGVLLTIRSGRRELVKSIVVRVNGGETCAQNGPMPGATAICDPP